MKACRYRWLKQPWHLPLRPNRFLALFLVVAINALLVMDFGVKASETANADEPKSSLADYRLSPGDELKLVVLDQPQLSGDFVIDGGGDILLPVAGSVSLSGLTLAQAQKAIQDRFAEGVLVQPAVSVRITKHRPVFVTGRVRKPGSYPFFFGESVKAAIATAGGEGLPLVQPENVTISDFITAQERVHQLESEQIILSIRKARLEAQRDRRENFVVPMLVGINRQSVDFDRAYSFESDTFSRLEAAHRGEVEALQQQQPLVKAEIKAVTDQIAKQTDRLGIVNSHLADLEALFRKGLLRKEVLLNQQIEKSLVEAQVSNLEAQVAHLRQQMGNLDLQQRSLKAAFESQTLAQLQQVSQRLRTVENSIAPARKILTVKAEALSSNGDDEREYTILISGVRDGRSVTFQATEDAMLLPGDVVEVKMKRRISKDGSSTSTQAMQSLDLIHSLAENGESASR